VQQKLLSNVRLASASILLLGLVGSHLAKAATSPSTAETTQTIVVHDDDIVPLHASLKETTLIVLPEREKAMGVFCGDKSYWNVDVIPGAERYVAVKPSKAGISTDIHIVTDRNNSYTLKATEGGDGPVDLKLFLKPADTFSLSGPPAFVPAAEMDRLKQQVTEAQAELKKVQEASAVKVKTEADQLRADYPDSLRFHYRFKRGKPFNVEEIWNDDRGFTYIRAHPEEAPAFYETKDGKPDLVQFEMRPDGLYFIAKTVESGYLRVGKQRLDFYREK
jgi:type IV secretion system protein VirB9